jgi:hypothetical protein
MSEEGPPDAVAVAVAASSPGAQSGGDAREAPGLGAERDEDAPPAPSDFPPVGEEKAPSPRIGRGGSVSRAASDSAILRSLTRGHAAAAAPRVRRFSSTGPVAAPRGSARHDSTNPAGLPAGGAGSLPGILGAVLGGGGRPPAGAGADADAGADAAFIPIAVPSRELPDLTACQRRELPDLVIFDYEKLQFVQTLEALIATLSRKSQVLRFKLLSYNRWYDASQVLIIFIGVLMAVITAVNAEIITYNIDFSENSSDNLAFDGLQEKDVTIGFNVTILTLSSVIVFIGSYVKARRWKEVANLMTGVHVQCRRVNSDLRRALGKARRIADAAELHDFRLEFDIDGYAQFLEVVREINFVLSYHSLVKHLKTYYGTNTKMERDYRDFRASVRALREEDS